jgi:hypothetical protein
MAEFCTGRYQLVYLLLVLDKDKGRLDSVQGSGKLLCDGRREEVQRDTSYRLAAKLRKEPFRMVADDQPHRFAPPAAEGDQSQTDVFHIPQVVLPVVGLPNSVSLFADCRAGIAETRRLRLQ